MADTHTAASSARSVKLPMPDLPLVIWMILLSLALGLASGLDAPDTVAAINTGFGRALGEFALILLPSFTLAAALSHRDVSSAAAERTAAFAAPVAGAGMICPDTAYAALAPAAGRYKLAMAFGAYAGFKLLYPAGPLIVATGLGGAVLAETDPSVLLLAGILLTLPVWAAGAVWSRVAQGAPDTPRTTGAEVGDGRLWAAFAPFLLMAGLLVLGGLLQETGIAALDFLLLPKGALLAAATLALLQTPAEARRACLDSAVRRTGSLLLVIGAASALGAVLTGMVDWQRLIPEGSGTATLLALFAVTVGFKLVQGSSMATFAAIAPVAAPIVAASGADPVASVFAICLGSFIAILPNDSYYWLVRGDALEHETKEVMAVRILAGGALLQASVGMALLLLWVMLLR